MKNNSNSKNLIQILKEIKNYTNKCYFEIFLDLIRCWITFGVNYSDYSKLKFYNINDDDKYELIKPKEDRKIFGKGISFVKVVYILFIGIILDLIFEFSPLWILIAILIYLTIYRNIGENKFSTTIICLLVIGIAFSILSSVLFYWSYSSYLSETGFVVWLGMFGTYCLFTIPEALLFGLLVSYILYPLLDRGVEALNYTAGIVIMTMIAILLVLFVGIFGLYLYIYFFYV